MSIDLAFQRRVFPPLAAIGAIVLAVALGVGRLPLSVTGFVVVLVGTGVLLAMLRQLGFGVALVPLIAAAVPISIGTGTQSPLVAGLLFSVLLMGVWMVRSCVTRELNLPRSLVVPSSIALILVWAMSYLFADANHSPLVYTWEKLRMARTGQLGVLVISVSVFLLALTVGRDSRWVQLATWSLVGLGVLGIVFFFTGLAEAPIGRFLSTGGLFTLWVVALAYSQALFNKQLPGWLRIGLVLLVVAWMYKAIFLQNIWFSGWVPALVAIAVITFFRSPRVFFPVLLLSAAVVAMNWKTVYAALWDAKVAEGDLSRVGIWDQALTLFHQSPILGTGPAGYAAYNMSVYLGSQYSMSTHSNYIDIVIETGIVGVVAFAWFLITLLVVGWQARTRWRAGFTGGFAQGAFGGLIGVCVAMTLGDWFIPFVYNQTIAGFRYTAHSWVFLGFLAALATMKPRTDVSVAVASSAQDQKVREPSGRAGVT